MRMVFIFETNLSNAPTPSDERVHAYGVREADGLKTGRLLVYFSREKRSHCERHILPIDCVYGNWGWLMNLATQASVGTDPWTVIQNELHPAVAEAEFTPLDWSCLRSSDRDTSIDRR